MPSQGHEEALTQKRMAAFKKVRHVFEYTLLRLAQGLLNHIPFRILLRSAPSLGIFLYYLLGRSRKITLENLRRVYGSKKSEADLQKIAKGSFINLAEFAIEWLRMPEMANHPERYLLIKNVERIHSALKERKGALLLVSHVGNWEVMALIGGLLIARPVGASIYALARPLKNSYIYEHVLRLRGLTGLMSIQKAGAVRQTFRHLKENGIICLLIDQRVSEGSVQTDFFGESALTTSLPAICALRFETPIFHVFLHRTPDLRYELNCEGPVPIENTGDLERDIRTNTQRFNDRVEAEIRKNPAQWLWMHNRWRVQHGPKD